MPKKQHLQRRYWTLMEKLHEKIKVVYIQDVAAAIRETGRPEWFEAFEMKYGMKAE
jgi:hypothetical protein